MTASKQKPKYWTFSFKPGEYQLGSKKQDDWRSGTSRVDEGDRVLIWQAMKDGKRGIVALGEILESARRRRAYPKYRDPGEVERARLRTMIRYIRLREPVWLEDDRTGTLRSLNVVRRPRGTVTNVTVDQWRRVLGIVRPVDARNTGSTAKLALQAAVSAMPGGAKRAGFGTTAAQRHAIEALSMRKAQDYYEARGYTVDRSVAKKHPFDLRCTRADEDLHVEVKGTQTSAEEILLTAGEVHHFLQYRGPKVLFIWHSVRIRGDKNTACRAVGGVPRVITNWRIKDRDLEPIGYWYRVPHTRACTPT